MQQKIEFEVLDYKTLTPLTNTWKGAVSVAIESAFDSGRLMDAASKVGLGLRALYDVADYHADKKIVVSDAEWLMAATALDKILIV